MSHLSKDEFLHELRHGTGKYPSLTTRDHLDVMPAGASIFGAPQVIGAQGESFVRVDLEVEGDKHWYTHQRETRVSPEDIPLPATIFFLPRKFQDQLQGDNS